MTDGHDPAVPDGSPPWHGAGRPGRSMDPGLPWMLEAWVTLPAALATLLGWCAGGVVGAAAGLLLGAMAFAALRRAELGIARGTEIRRIDETGYHERQGHLFFSLGIGLVMGILILAVLSLVPTEGYFAASAGWPVLVLFLPLVLLLLVDTALTGIYVGFLACTFLVGLALTSMIGIQGPPPSFGVLVARPAGAGPLPDAWLAAKASYEAGLPLWNSGLHFGIGLAVLLAVQAAVWSLFRLTRTRGSGLTAFATGIATLFAPLMAGVLALSLAEPSRPSSYDIAAPAVLAWNRTSAEVCQDVRARARERILSAQGNLEVARVTRETDRETAGAGCAPSNP